MARFPQSTIATLERLAQRFASLHPGLVGLLGRTSTHLSADRLRHGVFAIAASILNRIESFQADSRRGLADLIAAPLARPFPAATIVELLLHEPALVHVRAGAEVTLPQDPSCRFRLVGDVYVGPYRVEQARVIGRFLEFDLVATTDVVLADALGEELILYVDGPREPALRLISHSLAHTVAVEVRAPTGAARKVRGVRAYGMREEDLLAPEPDGPPNAGALLQEYFAFPQKFSFLAIGEIRAALSGTGALRATVTLTWDMPLPIDLAEDALRPHCIPAVNLFPAAADPQTFEPGRSSFPVRVREAKGSVYAVLSSTATPRDRNGPEIPLPNLRRFRAGRFSAAFPYAYSTQNKPRSDGKPQLFVTLTSPRGSRPVREPHVVSMRILATSGDRSIAAGELTRPGVGIPKGVAVRNIVSTSSYSPPPTDSELAFRAFVRGAIPRADALFNLQSFLLTLTPPAPATLARIHAIEQFEVTPTTCEGGSRRGYLATLIIDEASFRGVGDVTLFVGLLHQMLEQHADANKSYRCEAICRKSGERIQWPPRIFAAGSHRHPCPEYPFHAASDVQAPAETHVPWSSEPIANHASRYGFFELARLVDGVVEFTQRPSLSYPRTDVISVAPASDGSSVRLEMSFLGLIGPTSPLAAEATEAVLRSDDDGALRSFYDVLHHALTRRLYMAWKSRSIEGGFDLEGSDSLSQTLRSLQGVDPFTELDDDALPSMVALGFTDFQRGQPHVLNLRNAEGILQRLLPWPISLEGNIRRTIPLAAVETAHLGVQCTRLGEDFVYGVSRADTGELIRLHVGPVDTATYQRLMPGGDLYELLFRLTRRLFDAKLDVELEVHLSAEEEPRWELGTSGKLGADTRYAKKRGATHVRVLLLENSENVFPEFVSAAA